jgi:hypothetical protein
MQVLIDTQPHKKPLYRLDIFTKKLLFVCTIRIIISGFSRCSVSQLPDHTLFLYPIISTHQ